MNLLFLFIILVSNTDRTKAESNQIEGLSISADTAFDCYITDFITENGCVYIKVRSIHFLWGLSAVIEAKKDSAADFNIDKSTRDTIWFVPNDYYIIARNKNEFKIKIADNVKILIYADAVRRKITIEELLSDPFYYKIQLYNKYTLEPKEEMDYYPFEIAIEKGEVTVIQEIYVP